MSYLPSGTAFRVHVMVLPKRGKGSNLMKSEEKQDKDDFRMKYGMIYLPMSNEMFDEISAMQNEIFNEIPTNEQ